MFSVIVNFTEKYKNKLQKGTWLKFKLKSLGKILPSFFIYGTWMINFKFLYTILRYLYDFRFFIHIMNQRIMLFGDIPLYPLTYLMYRMSITCYNIILNNTQNIIGAIWVEKSIPRFCSTPEFLYFRRNVGLVGVLFYPILYSL